ncbi:MAG: hypothetical protein R3B81_02140 [bacterium]
MMRPLRRLAPLALLLVALPSFATPTPGDAETSPFPAESRADDRVPVLFVAPNIPFQGLLRDTGGNPVTGTVKMHFQMYDDPINVPVIWSETHAAVDVDEGLFRVELGSITPFPAGLFNGDRWLGISVEGEPELPRVQFLSAPFALQAGDADHAATADFATEASHALTADVATTSDDGDWIQNGSDLHHLNGRVGIGRIPTAGKLEIDGGSTEPWILAQGGGSTFTQIGMRLYDTGIGANNENVLEFAHGGSSGAAPIARLVSKNEGSFSLNGGSLRLEAASAPGAFNTNQLVLTRAMRIGVGTATPAQLLDVAGTTGTQHLRITGPSTSWGTQVIESTSGATNVEVRGQFSSTNTGAWMSLRDNGSERISFAARNGDTNVGGLIDVKNGSAIPTVRIVGDTGTGKGRITTPVIEITGGADLVEPFPTAGDRPLEPGTVVCIDPTRPGHLEASRRAYDRRVAGVVSGAGGLAPGIRMGDGGVNDEATLLAMVGRVWVKCTADNGPIAPGDLLTTSGRTGHAMRADDARRSAGASLGKAMSALEEGEGLVMVLVNLQ